MRSDFSIHEGGVNYEASYVRAQDELGRTTLRGGGRVPFEWGGSCYLRSWICDLQNCERHLYRTFFCHLRNLICIVARQRDGAMEELTRLYVYWQMVTAVATCAYAVLVLITLFYIIVQVSELRKNRKFQTALTLFRELQDARVCRSRRYIYKKIPVSIEGIGDEDLERHSIECENAVQMFHRVGYLLREKQIDPDPILENYWDVAWRCWRRTESLILWSRDKRNNPEHFFAFEHLYNVCEKYRKENGYPEPKFY